MGFGGTAARPADVRGFRGGVAGNIVVQTLASSTVVGDGVTIQIYTRP